MTSLPSWAMVNHSGYREFKADWKRYGNPAGPIRNQQMADYGADLCVHFPGGSGTADMVRRAKAAGITTIDGGTIDLQTHSKIDV